MAQGEARPGRRPSGKLALGFAIAALAAAWNPIAAPFGLVVGLASAVLGARALRGPGPRRIPAAAIGVGVCAAIASLAILVLTAGAVSGELPGEPVVKGRTRAQLEETLREAGERTRDRRERASRELEQVAGKRPDAGQAGGRDGGGRVGTAGADAGHPP